ncbi:MAG: YHS domain-containing protein [Bacteriovoracaceae bacterium]|nr:YHS domain-containing protein [Bacteriovoracaceae bacterium]
MKLVLFLILASSVFSCSHHHNKTLHHHHQFNKKCAYEVSQNHFDVEGKEEFKLEHNGEIYYFSSSENMKKFQSDIEAYVARSRKNWKKGF